MSGNEAAITKGNGEEPILNEDSVESAESVKPSKYKWYNVDPNAIPAKCAYFFECARRIGYQPNLVMFLTSIGMNKAEAGFIVGLRYAFVLCLSFLYRGWIGMCLKFLKSYKCKL